MILIGYLDSPFVRRVAVTAQYLALPYEHRELSIFRDFDQFRAINPLVKVPTLICDDGQTLVDSTLIIDYLESIAGRSLMPASETDRIRALNIIGTSMVAMEKVAQLIYETKQRPEHVQHAPWIDRLSQQLCGALELMEGSVGDGSAWFFGAEISQADITAAIAWRFVQHVVPERASGDDYPGLVAFSRRAELLPEFVACPIS
jgi:glutathione S-transferase